MDDCHKHQNVLLQRPNDHQDEREKNSYLNKRTHLKNTNDQHKVKDALSKFLADTELQDKDMVELFNRVSSNSNGDSKNTSNHTSNHTTNCNNNNNNCNDNSNNKFSESFLFDRKALMKASGNTSSKKQSRSRSRCPNSRKEKSGKTDRKKRNEKDRERRRRCSKISNKKKDSDDNNDDDSINHNAYKCKNKHSSSEYTCSGCRTSTGDHTDVDARSFVVDRGDGDDSEVSISSSDSRTTTKNMRKRTEQRTSVKLNRGRSLSRARSSTPRCVPRSPHSLQSPHYIKRGSSLSSVSSGVRTLRRPRSEQAENTSKKNCSNNINGVSKTLSMGLEDLNRQVRRDRIKEGYRSPSIDPRNRRQDNGDGEESVASGLSYRSTFTTRSSYKPSGLEGVALNTFIGNEHVAQNASRSRSVIRPSSGNCSVVSEPADENYMRERKARQDLIMDVAFREKWRYEEKSAKEAERLEKIKFTSEYYSSDDEIGTKKKKGLVKRIKKAARKTAKSSKSGVKGAANVVMDPKRTAKKAGKLAKGVGKETAKMVMDPSLVAKRGTQGIKGTVNLTANVAKGSFDVTSSLTKKGMKGTAMVVGGTIDGARRVAHGATGILLKQGDEEVANETYDDYDPKAMSDRPDRQVCKKTLAERFSAHEDVKVNKKRGETICSESRSSPEKTLKGKQDNGWWDL